MNSREFCYWLQGVYELNKPASFSAEQTELIRRHLQLVFQHDIDPSAGGPEVQAKLNATHEGLTKAEVEAIVGDKIKSQPEPFDHHNTLIRC